jgi:biotin carboxyl carrier protein
MKRRRLEALVHVGQVGEISIGAPAVGWLSDAPRLGEVVVGGSRVGSLRILDQWVDVTLPATVSGRVSERPLVNQREAVAYDQLVLRLAPVEGEGLGSVAAGPAAVASADLPAGCFAVVSPTHGMFYRRPKPGAPCYVEPGQVVEEGATLALVEVMKCFSAIAYGGEGLPPRAEVVEVRVEDNVEVAADQVLFVVRAARGSSDG